MLGTGAALENIIPVIPADTFIVTGGFVAGLGAVHPVPAFLFVWGFNVGGGVGRLRRWTEAWTALLQRGTGPAPAGG